MLFKSKSSRGVLALENVEGDSPSLSLEDEISAWGRRVARSTMEVRSVHAVCRTAVPQTPLDLVSSRGGEVGSG